MKRILIISCLILAAITAAVQTAFAHVAVHPNTAGIGTFQIFSVSVPVEKEVATVGLRLLIPSGLEEVLPNVKPGWHITVKKNGDAVSEIDWTGGYIPPDERDDFVFGAQVPSQPTTLQWRAYQIYQDGTVVSWDQDPNKSQSDDAVNDSGPYSETSVFNDLTAVSWWNAHSTDLAIALSLIAILLSGYVLS